MEYKIMIVEDDEIIAGAIAAKLQKYGLKTAIAEDFQRIDEEFLRYDPALLILDISLPFYNGYMWCEKIRQFSKVPVLYISSMSDNMNIIMAMNMGGDDYLAKPFDLDVLVAKVQALLRRAYDYKVDNEIIKVGDFILRIDDQSLIKGKQHIELTKNEFRILRTLFEAAGRLVSRDELMQKLWETNEFIDDNTLTVNIARLRKKLEDVGIYDFIITKKGQGYIIKDEDVH